jgi:hypothetical protein
MSNRIHLGVLKAEILPPSSADVTESGSLNLPELSEPHRPVMGMLYFYLHTWWKTSLSNLNKTYNIVYEVYGNIYL